MATIAVSLGAVSIPVTISDGAVTATVSLSSVSIPLSIQTNGQPGPAGADGIGVPDPSGQASGSLLEVQGGSLAYTQSLENSALTIDGGLL